MSRLFDLIQIVNNKFPNDDFFQSFEKDLNTNESRKEILNAYYNDTLITLDNSSWLILKEKVLTHFQDHRTGQKKQGFFNQLNEALAYQYLVNLGFTNIKILAEDGQRTPDISYTENDKELYCEVKTLGISDDEISRRSSVGYVDRTMYGELSDEYFKKLNFHLLEAQSQIKSRGEGIVFIIIRFDDFTCTYQDKYREQITRFINCHAVAKVVIKFEQGYESIYKNDNS